MGNYWARERDFQLVAIMRVTHYIDISSNFASIKSLNDLTMYVFLLLQLALLLAVFSIEAYVRLRLVRPMLRAKHVKTQMEESAGGGQEVSTTTLLGYFYYTCRLHAADLI